MSDQAGPAVLDSVLENWLVSVTEDDQLLALAGELDHVAAAHRIYVEALATAAYADGVVNDVERADLDRVATLLGMGSRDVDMALAMVRSGAQVSLPRRADVFAPGDRIVFTGAMSRTRDELEETARIAGLQPMSSASKQTAVLVCADPHSQSAKARALGVRVISDAVFLDALRVVVGSRA